MQKTQNDVSIDAIACGFRSGFGEMAGISFCLESAIASGFRSGFGEMASISFCLESAIACGFRVGFGEMASISSRGGYVRVFTYDYVKTHLEHPAPHDLLSSGGGNKVCFATTPPDMEASCIKKQQNGYDSRYTFSAKELDDETQYSYFGARYYDSDLSVWLSVDPLADKYPSMSPYMYCAGNPVMLVDPDGRWIPGLDDDGNVTYTAEKGDNRETFMNQYGLSAKQTIDIFDKSNITVAKAGETVISGSVAKEVTGSEVLKLDWNSKRATTQRKVDQVMFSIKYSQVNNNYTFDLKDFNTNMESGNGGFGYGCNFKGGTIRTRNGVKIPMNSMDFPTKSYTNVQSYPQPPKYNYSDNQAVFTFRGAKANRNNTIPMIMITIPIGYDEDFMDYYYNPGKP